MAPKYNSKYYNLGTYYPQWSDAKKDAVDQALNMIMENSPAGEVLAGKEANKVIFLSNAAWHTGSDSNKLDHINFVIRTLGTGTQTGEKHLYANGDYTDSADGRRYQGNPGGAVKAAESKQADLPTDDDFPPLGR